MKTTLLSLISAATVLSFTSCTDMGPNTQRGAATGALLGAAGGAVIGHQSGRALEGAAIGGAAGGVIGGTYGNARDQEERRYYRGY
jgi:uncharacterized protein YcfJ